MAVEITDYEVLDLTGMNQDRVELSHAILEADFGDGYGASSLVGASAGTHVWELSAGALPDDTTYGTISSKTRSEYYWDFYTRHMAAGNKPFLMQDMHTKNYFFVCFVDHALQYEIFTSAIYSTRFSVRQRRIKGFSYRDDGSVIDPSLMSDIGIWLKNAGFSSVWEDQVGTRDFTVNADVVKVTAGQNGRDFIRLNNSTGSGYLSRTFQAGSGPDIKEAFFAVKFREDVFDEYRGLLTFNGPTTGAMLVGQDGNTIFTDLTLTGFSYTLNGESYAEDAQAAPMNVWGVVHLKCSGGLNAGKTALRIGRDRDATDRYALVDIGEVILNTTAVSASEGAYLEKYLMKRWL